MHKLYSLLIICLLIPCCSLFSESHFKIKTIQISSSAIWCANRMDVSIKKKIVSNYYYNNEHYYIQNYSSEKLKINNEDQNNPEAKGWKKPLIIPGELAGAFFVGHVTTIACDDFIVNEEITYIIGESLGATCGTILMGKLLRQNGSAKGALIGSVIGTAVGSLGFYVFLSKLNREEFEGSLFIGFIIASVSPSVGSIIGYNIK